MNIPKPTLKEHEKFWAFVILVVAIIGLAILATSIGGQRQNLNDAAIAVLNSKLRIIDVSIAGLIGIAGMAAQALFRISQTDKDQAAALMALAEKAPQPTQSVEVVNTPEKPAIVSEAAPVAPVADPSDERPSYAV